MFDPHSIPYGFEVKLDSSFFQENRDRLVGNVRSHFGNSLKPNSYIIMKSGSFYNEYDNDVMVDHVAEPSFFYLFGNEKSEKMYGIIELDTKKAILSVQDTTVIERVIDKSITKDINPQSVNCDQIIYNSELEIFFKVCVGLGDIFLNNGNTCFSPQKSCLSADDLPWLASETFTVNKTDLFPILMNQRTIKSERELTIMRHICQIACDGHVFAMKRTKPGHLESNVATLFKFYTSWKGCNSYAYIPICGSGKFSAILHYELNDQKLHENDLILCDMGCRSNMYCSDITTTWPVNGKFTPKQKTLYNIVYGAQKIILNL